MHEVSKLHAAAGRRGRPCVREHYGSVELWWRERLPLQDVTDARPSACLRGGEDWADGGDDDIDDYDAHGARLDGGVLSDAGA